MLEVSFVRRRGNRDRVYVKRDDGSSVDWSFPSYGDGLPHDLCHLVVEDELGLDAGFWGLIDQGVDVRLVNNAATLMRGGRPLVEDPGFDFTGLNEAEAAVAAVGSPTIAVDATGALAIARVCGQGDTAQATPDIVRTLGVGLPASATPQAIATIARRLAELGGRWRSLDDGGAINTTFTRRRGVRE